MLLTGGWARLARGLPDRQGLPPGTTLTVGNDVQITLAGSNWQLSRADTEKPLRYVLTNTHALLIVNYVEFTLTTTMDEAWVGFDKLLTLGGWDVGSVRLDSTGGDGNQGQSTLITHGSYAGTATIFLSSYGHYGVELLAYEGTAVDTSGEVAADDAVHTVTFVGGA